MFFCVSTLTTRGSKKLSSDAPQEDFKTYVHELLTCLCEGQNKIIQDISDLKAKVQSNEVAFDKLSKQFTTLNQSFKELKGELQDARLQTHQIRKFLQEIKWNSHHIMIRVLILHSIDISVKSSSLDCHTWGENSNKRRICL